jgi:hypothetical protein
MQERLELSAANAAPSASLWDEWRLVIIALHPLVMFVLLYIGDKLSVVKKKSSTSENLAAVTPVLDTFTSPPTAPPSTTQSSNLADSLSFNGFYGFTGVFVAVALLATGVLALYFGVMVELSEIEGRTMQTLCFHLVALQAFFYWFSFVMYWRAQVNTLVDVHTGHVDPLEALDNIPIAKRLVKWYVRAGGRKRGDCNCLLLTI